jgi:ATP-dependent exoDNAse (exonuclease V) alpha subunit
MIDNKIMLQLQEAAQLKNAKVILVGDSRQLQPIGVGNSYTNLVKTNKISTCMLSDIRRQQDNQTLLNAVKEAVHGDINKSLELVSDSTREIKSINKRFTAITKEYTGLTPAQQDKTIVLTASNKDRIKLSDRIRDELIKSGKLQTGQEFKVKSGKVELVRNFAQGDRIMFFQNNHKLGVKNGQVAKIIEIDGDKITVQSGKNTISFQANKYNHFDHGYAMTTHKAQGITVDRAIINIDSSQKILNNRNAFYVDISRARHKVSIFCDDKTKIGKQVGEFVKKVTSNDFLIKATSINKPPLISIPKPIPKLSLPTPSISIPLPGPLKILNVPFKVAQATLKAGVKVVQAATQVVGKGVEVAKMANTAKSLADEPSQKRKMKMKRGM